MNDKDKENIKKIKDVFTKYIPETLDTKNIKTFMEKIFKKKA
jgi:hypothetical protein